MTSQRLWGLTGMTPLEFAQHFSYWLLISKNRAESLIPGGIDFPRIPDIFRFLWMQLLVLTL
jgi:hypothetical protein